MTEKTGHNSNANSIVGFALRSGLPTGNDKMIAYDRQNNRFRYYSNNTHSIMGYRIIGPLALNSTFIFDSTAERWKLTVV